MTPPMPPQANVSAMKPKISLDAIKALRDETGAPVGEVRKALEDAGGDPAKARALLQQRGGEAAAKRQGRATGQGRVECYVHHDGRLAALVEVNCETDFVARTDDFKQFCRDVAMHVAAMDPEGSVQALMAQPFVRDQGTTVGDLLKTLVGKTGENVVIRRFARFAVGEAVS